MTGLRGGGDLRVAVRWWQESEWPSALALETEHGCFKRGLAGVADLSWVLWCGWSKAARGAVVHVDSANGEFGRGISGGRRCCSRYVLNVS